MPEVNSSFSVLGRRQLLLGAAAGAAGSLCFAGNAPREAAAEILHSEEAIHQETQYKAKPG
ncbi:MAG TPA: hypothetical protein VIM00_14770, partial [Candidatus Acidoferrum sp.]